MLLATCMQIVKTGVLVNRSWISLFMLIFMVTNDCQIVRLVLYAHATAPPPHNINKIAEDPQVCQKDIQATLARKAGQWLQTACVNICVFSVQDVFFQQKFSTFEKSENWKRKEKRGGKKKEKKRKLGQGINSRWFVPYYYFTTACENNSKNSLHSHFQDPISHIVWMKPQSNCTLNSELSYICLCRCKWLPRSSHISRNATFEKLTWTSFLGQFSRSKLLSSPLQSTKLANKKQFEVFEAGKNTLCSLPKRSVQCVKEEGQKDGGWKHYKLGHMEEH